MIVADKLKKSFGSQLAVEGLSFEIKRGECFGLLGPNGAGKSTTINLLVGLLRPDSGTVKIEFADRDGRLTSDSPLNPNMRKHLGVAPQPLSLYEELTAIENLRFFGSLYGLSGSRLNKRVEWTLAFAGLNERSQDRVAHYSGGMKRRLNIAAALIHEPTVLLLDEPTVGVDPQSRNHIFDCIEQLKSSGMTLLYTTHYMEEAQRLCDRIAIMDHGKLLGLDTVNGWLQTHGGESVVIAELKPETLSRSDFSTLNLPGSLEGSRLRFESRQPLDAIAGLVSSQVQFQTLQIMQPDLESVFLSLTGRSLRDG